MTETRDIRAAVPNWSARPVPAGEPMAGQYVRLERLDADAHAAEIFALNSLDDSIWEFLPYGPFSSAAQYHRWVRDITSLSDPFLFAIRSKQLEHWGGVAALMRINPESGSIEVGHICLSKPLQRTPAATEAIYLMMGWAFSNGYRRFEWKCDAANLPSRRAAQRFGFSFEGVFRQATVVKGRNRDTAWFAMIDSEWPALQAAFDAWLNPTNFASDGRQIESLGDLTGLVRAADDPAL